MSKKNEPAKFDDVQIKAGALEEDDKKVAAPLQKVREYEAAAHETRRPLKRNLALSSSNSTERR